MPDYDFAATRLFVEDPLAENAPVVLEGGPANYLRNVLRLGEGDGLLVFNGRDGEWGARIAEASKKRVALTAERLVRPQTPAFLPGAAMITGTRADSSNTLIFRHSPPCSPTGRR